MMVKNLKDLVLQDLGRAQRLIRAVKDEIDPQFIVMSSDGGLDFWIAMTLSAEASERRDQFRVLSDFMASKLARGFTMAAELKDPDAVFCFGATHNERCAVLSRIGRMPLQFDPPEWIPSDAIGPEILSLLPSGARSIDQAALSKVERAFGPSGQFPAVPIDSASWRRGKPRR